MSDTEDVKFSDEVSSLNKAVKELKGNEYSRNELLKIASYKKVVYDNTIQKDLLYIISQR